MCRENDLLTTKSKNIVVVDDEKTTTDVIKTILNKSLPDCNVKYFNDTDENFCEYIFNKDIDLYILDVILKEKSGITLSEDIINSNQGSIFLFISGYNYNLNSFKNLSGKCIYDFMAKPFDHKGFIASVIALLNISTTYNMFQKTIDSVDSARDYYKRLIEKDKIMIEDFKNKMYKSFKTDMKKDNGKC